MSLNMSDTLFVEEVESQVFVEQVLKAAVTCPLDRCIFNLNNQAGLDQWEISELTLVPVPKVVQSIEKARLRVKSYLIKEAEFAGVRISAVGTRV